MPALPLRPLAVLVLLGAHLAAEDFSVPVPGWTAPAAGEHPRLFFRKADLAALRQKAQTPGGTYIVERLKFLLNGSDGRSLPAKFNSKQGKNAQDGSASDVADADEGEAFTLWHAAGYGMLHLLTQDALYADLGRQCVVKMLEGQRDRDQRYSFRAPHGALRAGPSLGAMAMAYDLLHDGLPPELRQQVALAMQDYSEGQHCTMPELAEGKRHGPHSNHYGCQVGGAALALLAIQGDPGVDAAKVAQLQERNRAAMAAAVIEGSGDGGFFWEGRGPGGINTDTALVPAFQAWRVAGGRDFVTPRPNVAAIQVIKLHELVVVGGEPCYPIEDVSGYGSGSFAASGGKARAERSDRTGLSRGGQFCQGFGVMPEQLKPAMLAVYDTIVEPDPAKRTYDTVSLYPHRPVLALVNWPIGMKPADPATILPKVHWDTERGHYSFRNQWTGTESDIVVTATFSARDPHPISIWGAGRKDNAIWLKQGKVTHFQPAADGSGTVSTADTALGVDFSRSSGADALVVMVGPPGRSKKGGKGGGASTRSVTAGTTTFQIITVGGKPAEPQVQGDRVAVGGQTVAFDGTKIVFGTMAGPPTLPRQGLWKQ